jgi:hypothetical protein
MILLFGPGVRARYVADYRRNHPRYSRLPEYKKVGPHLTAGAYLMLNVGGDLLSHTLTSAVPSALEGLASGFGMGPGVPRSAKTTDNTIHLSRPAADPSQRNR